MGRPIRYWTPVSIAAFFAVSLIAYQTAKLLYDPGDFFQSVPYRLLSLGFLALFAAASIWFFIRLIRAAKRDLKRLSATTLIALLAAILLAAALRFHKIDWGLPLHLHFDEANNIYRGEVIQRHPYDIHPRRFAYPSTIYYLIAGGASASSAWTTIEHRPFIHDHTSYTAVRGLMAFLGILATICVFLAAKWAWGSEGGAILAGFVAAASPLAIEYAHAATPEAPLMFFLTAAAYLTFRSMNDEQPDWILPAAAAAFAVGSKYNGFPAAIMVAAAMLIKSRESKGSTSLIGVMTAIGAFAGILILCSPFLLLDPVQALGGIGGEVTHYFSTGHPGAEGLPGLSNAAFHFRHLFLDWLSPTFAMAVAAGIAMGLFRKRKILFLVSIAPILTLVVAVFARVTFDRLIAPALPFLAIAAGATALIYRRENTKSFLIWAGAAIMLATPPATVAWQHWTQMSLPDARYESTQWIAGNLPAGTMIGVTAYGPQLRFTSMKGVAVDFNKLGSIEELRRKGVRFLATSSWHIDPLATSINNPDLVHKIRFLLTELNGTCSRIKTFGSDSSKRGPKIDIWKLGS